MKLSLSLLLSEASVTLRDDITNPSGSVELMRLTLTKLFLRLTPEQTSDPAAGAPPAFTSGTALIDVYCSCLQVDNQLYNRASFHFPVLLCQEQRGGAEPGTHWSSNENPSESPELLEEFKHSCFLHVRLTLSGDGRTVEEVGPRTHHQSFMGLCLVAGSTAVTLLNLHICLGSRSRFMFFFILFHCSSVPIISHFVTSR